MTEIDRGERRTVVRRILVAVQYFHEDKLSGFRRPANFLADNGSWHFVIPSHRIDGVWAGGDGAWKSVEARPVRSRRGGKALSGSYARYLLEYWRCLRSEEPPVSAVYMVAPPVSWSLPVALLARVYRVPSVVDLGDPEASVSSGFAATWRGLSEKLVRKLSARVIVASPDAARPADEVIVTGAGEEFFQVGRKRLERGAGGASGELRIVYAGTFDDLRPMMPFLTAWSRFVQTHPSAVLELVGRGFHGFEEGELREEVERLGISGNVLFRGFVPPEGVPEVLAEVDWGLVQLNPDRGLDYAIPTKMIEYFAAGLPVLAIGGQRVRRIIEESGGGVWVDPRRLAAEDPPLLLASVLDRNRSALACQAFRYAQSHFQRADYQAGVNRVFAGCARPWSGTIERGLDWLERNCVIGEPDLPAGRLAVRLAVPPPHISGSDHWAYLEITAYTAVLYLALHALSSRERYLERAVALGRWLMDCQTDTGSIPFAYMFNRREFLGPCFAFDTGMAARAWLLLHGAQPDPAWREAASRAGRWLVGRMQRPDGSFRAAEDTITGPMPEPAPPCYYGSGGALHVKLALTLDRLADAFPDDPTDYQAAHTRLIGWARRLQTADGAFPIGAGSRHVNSHTHSYALEGFLSEPNGWNVIRRGLEWSLQQTSETGWLPETNEIPGRSRSVTDSTAQTLRLLGLARRSKEAGGEVFQAAARNIALRLRKARCRTGGWPAWPGKKRWKRPGPPVWPTILALSAFLFWERDDLDERFLF